jgi:PAS domain S-box-containing protein
MFNQPDKPHEWQELRDQAEAKLSQRPAESGTALQIEYQRLLHELQVYQVELELQNEELRRSQHELHTTLDKYQRLYDLAPVGYVTLDARGTILEANSTAATMLGASKSDLIGTSLHRFIVSDDQDAFYIHRRQLYETGACQPCDLRLRRLDGTAFVAYLESRVVSVIDGHVQQCLTTLSDITVRHQEEAAQRQTERLASLGTFAAGLAHELNNPLCAITSTAEHALDALANAHAIDGVDECFSNILADATRCAQIVQRVLAIARQGDQAREPLDLHLLMHTAYELTQPYARKHNVTSHLALAQAQPRILAKQDDIEFMLINLMRNAVEACADGGDITVATTVVGQEVRIQVHDTGVGLSDEAQQHMFDPFYTTRQERGGTGLGLSLVHRIIMDHGGTMTVQSTVGQGTTMCVRFPLVLPDVFPLP